MRFRTRVSKTEAPDAARRVARSCRRVLISLIASRRTTVYTPPTDLFDEPRPTHDARRFLARIRGIVWGAASRSAAGLEDWRRAQTYAERWVWIAPENPVAWRSLATALDRGGFVGAMFMHPLGIVTGDTGDHDRATAAYRIAAEIDPSTASSWTELAAAEIEAGDLEAAEEAMDRAAGAGSDGSAVQFTRGRLVLATSRHQGGFRPSQFDEIVSAWGEAVTTSGTRHEQARFHLVRVATQHADWQTAFAAAWPGRPSPVLSPDEVVNTISGSRSSPPRDWWLVAGWYLGAAGMHRQADLARRRMAEDVVAAVPSVFRSGVPATIEAAQARAALGDLDGANDLLDRVGRHRLRPPDAAACSKLAADVALRCGMVEPLRQWRDRWAATPHPQSEARFRELISGRSVAVVGPAPSGHAHGAEIDGHDTVIRTKWLDGMSLEAGVVGSRTDIAYYSDSSAAVLEDRIHTTLADGGRMLAVLRPSAFQAGLGSRLPADTVRFTHGEDLATVGASHFALQRIIYDLVTYEPRSVTLYHANYYTRHESYAAGYQSDGESAYDERGLMRVLPMYGHDLGADFRFARTLFEHGLFDGDPTIRDLLTLTDDEYFALVDGAGSDPVTGPPR